MKSFGRAVGMAVMWAAAWGAVAILIGMFVDPDNSMDEMWVAIGGFPGALAGLVFSVVLGIAARRRGIEGLPLSRVAVWGGATGLILGLFPLAVCAGLPDNQRSVWLLAIVILGATIAVSALLAVSSAILFGYRARSRAPARV